MKQLIIITALLSFIITGCQKEKVNVMAVPIEADDFYDLQNKIKLHTPIF